MSATEKSVRVARRACQRLVAYGREFALIGVYAAISVAVTAPTIIATGTAIYWLSVELGLEGPVRTAYYGVGVLGLMVVFAMLHRVVQRLGRMLLGRVREPYYQV